MISEVPNFRPAASNERLSCSSLGFFRFLSHSTSEIQIRRLKGQFKSYEATFGSARLWFDN